MGRIVWLCDVGSTEHGHRQTSAVFPTLPPGCVFLAMEAAAGTRAATSGGKHLPSASGDVVKRQETLHSIFPGLHRLNVDSQQYRPNLSRFKRGDATLGRLQFPLVQSTCGRVHEVQVPGFQSRADFRHTLETYPGEPLRKNLASENLTHLAG